MRTITSFYLTRSRLRTDLLVLFFSNFEEAYYLRELARRLTASPGALMRELKSMAETGLLERKARGREIFYKVNRTYPLFSEIKSIVEKTAGIPLRMKEGLKKIKEIRQAYLYGSYVKGKMQLDSDIDLLLVGRETGALKKLIKNFEGKIGRSISTAIYSEEEFSRKRKDKSEFLFEVMKSPLIQIKP